MAEGTNEFDAESLRIRMAAQKLYAEAALKKLDEIAMCGTGAVQVSALREMLDQTLGRPYAPQAIAAGTNEEFLAIIDRRGEELRAKLDRMSNLAAPGPAEPADQSRSG